MGRSISWLIRMQQASVRWLPGTRWRTGFTNSGGLSVDIFSLASTRWQEANPDQSVDQRVDLTKVYMNGFPGDI